MRAVLVALSLVGLLASCSTAAPAPPSKATPSPTRPADGGTYDSPAQLAAALGKLSQPCIRYEEIQGATGALARGRCYVMLLQVERDIPLGIYASEEDVRAQIGRQAGFGMGYNILRGRNWTVSGPLDDAGSDYIENVKDALGGTIERTI